MSRPVDPALLDAAWDFGDPMASEGRLRRLRDEHAGNALAVAEIDTQVARALGLQGRYDEALRLLEGIAEQDLVVLARVDLEHGRVLNSRGEPDAARTLFAAALEHAVSAGNAYLQVDALHMLAIVDGDRAADWTQQGIAIAGASTDPRTRRWLGALHNNFGWYLHDTQHYADALTEFDLALTAYSETGTEEQVRIAHWCRARCLRSLSRHYEALAIQERLKAEGPTDRFVDEELEILRGLMPGAS